MREHSRTYFVSRVQHFEEYLQVEATSEEEARDKFYNAIDSGAILGHSYRDGDGELYCEEIKKPKVFGKDE
tara:strand:+ start:210 stop:422 length:213 start_codon:yes stop_codon:yes gene_type:complete